MCRGGTLPLQVRAQAKIYLTTWPQTLPLRSIKSALCVEKFAVVPNNVPLVSDRSPSSLTLLRIPML
eukprot:5664159-Amphidinium_carterae.1